MIVTPVNERASAWYRDLGFEKYPREGHMFLPIQTAITNASDDRETA